MHDPPPIFIRRGAEVGGPLTLTQLRQMAEVGAVGPETEVAATAEGPWTRLREQPDLAAPFAPPRQFGFKARSFERVNEPGGAPVDHREIIRTATRMPPAGESPAKTSAAPDNDVLQILQDNVRMAAPSEKPLTPVRRSNRRLWDYLLLMTGINGSFLLCIGLTWGNPVTAMFALGGMAVFSAGLTWTMFGVMSRY